MKKYLFALASLVSLAQAQSWIMREASQVAYIDSSYTIAELQGYGLVNSDLPYYFPDATFDTTNAGTSNAKLNIIWSVKYRYGYPSTGFNLATATGVLVYFHGNSTGTKDDMLNGNFGWVSNYAWENNLIPVVIASPSRMSPTGARAWNYDQDVKMIHDLITQNLDGYINIDKQKVFYWGASQGSCLLNSYLSQYGGDFGGGSYVMCGCLDNYDDDYQPSQAYQDNYKVFVQANTGDFLWTPSRDAVEMHRYNHGVKNLRFDLTHSGGHCGYNPALDDSVMSWMLGGNDVFPEPAFEPHWQRMHSFASTASAMEVGSNNIIYVAVRENQGNALYNSTDLGVSWTRLATIGSADTVTDMSILDNGDVWVSARNGTYRLVNGTSSFSQINSLATDELWTNGTNLVSMEWDNGYKNWNGSSFTQLSYYSGRLLGSRGDFRQTEGSARTPFFWSYKSGADGTRFRLFKANASSSSFTEVPTSGWNWKFLSGDQQGNTIAMRYGVTGYDNKLMVSTDGGSSFTQKNLPPSYDTSYTGSDLKILPNGNILFFGSRSGYVSSDLGQNWTRVANLRQHDGFFSALSDGTLLSTRGKSIYKYLETLESIPVANKPTLPTISANRLQANGDRLYITASANWILNIHNMQGKLLWSTTGQGNQAVIPTLQKGAYALVLQPSAGNAIHTMWVK